MWLCSMLLPQKKTASSTGPKLIKTTPISLLYYSIFGQIKINGPHLTLPHFILATEQPLRSSEYKATGKMVLLKSILAHYPQLALIIVPKPLRCKVFCHFHAGPTGSHMGEYKTLYRMWLKFFWTGLRTDVNALVKGFYHYLSYRVWRNW